MKIKALILASMVAAASFFAPAPARAVECDQQSSGLRLCLPRYGTDFDQWATSDVNALTIINSSAAIVGSTTTYNPLGWIAVNRISGIGTGTAGIRISSFSYYDSSAYVLMASSLTVSSHVFINGNLGLGTAAPGNRLELYNQQGEGIQWNNAASGNKKWTIASNSNDLAISEVGVGQSITFQAGGNLGVGTTNPCSTCTLHVIGNIVASVGVRASTGVFTSTGLKQFSVISSSGISIAAGGIQWPDGTVSTTSAGAGINIYVASGPTSGVGSIQLPQRATHYFDGAYFTLIDSQTNNSSIITLNIASTTSVGTRQVLTSGTLYTTPANVNQIKVRMVGGGGGGAGANNGGVGTAGGNAAGTTFNSITAAGGMGGAIHGNSGGGAGGTGGAGSASYRAKGFTGHGSGIDSNYSGGAGGGSLLGGGGTGVAATNTGGAGAANSGGGGAGGNNVYVGAGGGGGEYVELIINSPAASYSYSISTGATGGVATANGGAGGSGVIIVDEYYPTIGPTGPTGPAGALATASDAQINGQLTVVGTVTVQGASFSVGGSTAVASSGGWSFGGTGTFGSTLTYRGANNGVAAVAGRVGELISATKGGSSVAFPASGSVISVATLTLTAGEWDITGMLQWLTGGTTAATVVSTCISATAGSCDTIDLNTISSYGSSAFPVSKETYLGIGPYRVRIAATTSYYLGGSLTYTVLGGAEIDVSSGLRGTRIR